MNHKPLRLTLGIAALGLPAPSLAHAGGGRGSHHGFAAGFAHPLSGIDHLLAMLLIGVWSASLFGTALLFGAA